MASNHVTETPAYRLAMPFNLRHAASTSMTLDLNQSRTSRPWVGRSSRKGSWFTLATSVLAFGVIEQSNNLTMRGSVKKGAIKGSIKAYIFLKLGVYYLRIHGFRTTLFAIRDLR
jgi:hypothetical protein